MRLIQHHIRYQRDGGPSQNYVIPAKAGASADGTYIQRGGAIGARTPKRSLRYPDQGFCNGLRGTGHENRWKIDVLVGAVRELRVFVGNDVRSFCGYQRLWE